MSLPEQIQVAIFFWVSLIYILTLLRVAHLGLNAKFLLILQYKNGHPTFNANRAIHKVVRKRHPILVFKSYI